MLYPGSKSNGENRRVVVTGAGIVTAHGTGWSQNAEGFRTGATQFKPVTLFDTARHRVHQAAEVVMDGRLPSTRLSARQEQKMDRAERLLLLAFHEAITSANLVHDADSPVVLGTTSGGMNSGQAFYLKATATPAVSRGRMSDAVHYQIPCNARLIATAFGIHSPFIAIANACASGADAVGRAWEMVRYGGKDRVIAGGYDALSQLVFAGFDALQALSPTHCKPFDVARDGLGLGEGAAVMILESLESAEGRGAKIVGEICGYGAACDSHHLTQPHPEGVAAVASMREACARAGVHPRQIGYINAHGTGTVLNDSAEAAAINTWAGADAGSIHVSSTKASIGHLLGAAGAVEVIACLMALEGQWLPPMLTCENPDPACQFQVVTKPGSHGFKYALTNSFGFGGSNASLVLRRWK